jgi:hypothetical protein
MTTPISYPLVDGFRKSFVSIEAVFTAKSAQGGPAMSLNFRGFKNIEMSRTRTRVEARGNHPDPLGKTRGTNAYKAAVEILIEEFNQLQAELAGINSAYGDVLFTFTRTYTENGSDTITDTAIGCSFDTTESTDAEGAEPSMRKIELNPLKILFNGIDDTTPLAPVPV